MFTNPTIFGAVTSFIDAGLGDVLAVDVITIINKKPGSYDVNERSLFRIVHVSIHYH